jgi:hypothetical protein
MDEGNLIKVLGGKNTLLNGFPAFDYRASNPDVERARLHEFLDRMLLQ